MKTHIIFIKSIHLILQTTITPHSNHNKIDYIIFLDSDDYWKPYCIEECIKHSDGVDIVWFDYELYFDRIETGDEDKRSIFEPYQSDDNIITQQDWLQGFVHSKQICFSNVCLTLINFYFFKSIQLTFVDYAIYEDVNFGTLLFLQSQKIFLLQQPFYTYRMRKNSTTNTTQNTPVPHYVKHIYDTFKDKQVVRKYHTCSSWFLMLLEFMEFINANPSKLDDKAKQKFLSPYIEPSCHLLSFKHDPLNLIPKLIILEPYLSKKFKWRDRLRITNPAKYNRLKPLFNIYDSIKGIERTIRRLFRPKR